MPPVLQYSFSLTTFSPSGKLVQIEYALAAVAAGATSLGIRATNGVVLATEKKLPSILVDESTVQKISLLTPNIGLTYSGMGPDSRVLVRKARKSGQVYFRQFHEQIPVAQLCRETAAVMQEFTRECWVWQGGVEWMAQGACRRERAGGKKGGAICVIDGMAWSSGQGTVADYVCLARHCRRLHSNECLCCSWGLPVAAVTYQ